MATKYYHLTDYDDSIGVIKSEDNRFNFEAVKEAIEQHLGEEIKNLKILNIHTTETLEITYHLEDDENLDSGAQIVNGQLTHLFF